ncbi:MAG: ABC-F family ATP-binding cassette domain-containing protein [Myxococcota bacterium]
MSLLVAENLSLSFGHRTILDGDGVRLDEGDRVGLVGPNGSGKSTLLKILAGSRAPDGGTVTLARGCRVAYLPQDVMELPGGPLLDSVVSSVPGRAALEERLTDVEAELATADEAEAQMHCAQRLADLHDELAHFETRFSRHAAERILSGLGFRAAEFARPTSELSGGWRMRAALAALLFAAPDVLLLDEPTNHLDLPSVRWLEEFMRGVRQALVLICHDREFLNRQVGRILAFEVEGLRTYHGNYDGYVRQRAQEEEVLRAAATNQERERREAERFIDRFRAQASKARAVQSRIKRLEKMDEVTLLETRATVRVRFPAVEVSGALPVSIEGVSKAFGALRLYDGLSLHVRRGQRVAIVGVNGAGKTTLLKIISGELAPDAGTVRFGHNVQLAYYAQHHADALDPRRTVLDEVGRLVPSWNPTRVRSTLGAFLFSGDDVDKPIRVLSGGERARVALAKLLVRPGNVLLMDEPTNHLDTASAEALADALEAFGGTLVFVSHNLSFARRLATRVWDVSGGTVIEYPGTLADYLARTEAASARPTGGADAAPDAAPARPPVSAPRPVPAPAPVAGAAGHAARRARAAADKTGARRLDAQRHAVAELEARIAALEAEQKRVEALLADDSVYADAARSRELLSAYQLGREKIEELMERWARAQGELRVLDPST